MENQMWLPGSISNQHRSQTTLNLALLGTSYVLNSVLDFDDLIIDGVTCNTAVHKISASRYLIK